MLKQTFFNLVNRYNNNNEAVHDLWTEIEISYSNKKRHYHTLSHLDNLLNQLTELKDMISNWDTVLFALYYHDITYNVLKNNNEEKSAQCAEKRMMSISVRPDMIEQCKRHILATKAHTINQDNDTNIFTDADLSILGSDWNTYSNYSKQVRKEYSVFPDFIYNPGRKKMLTHFLGMTRIFKTSHFFEKFELQARKNLRQELDQL